MTSPVFMIERERLLAGERILLDGDEGRHAARVRRIGVGERVDVTDGRGLLAECEVAAVTVGGRGGAAGTGGRGGGRLPDGLELDVIARREEPPPQPRLVVVQALPKGDRGELAVETMTEVGVDAVVPWAAARCVTQWRGERGAKALARWRAAGREAAKQARRTWLPEVTESAGTREVAGLLAGAAMAVVLHEEADRPLSGAETPAAGDIVVVVGPEGGITPDELELFAAAGGRPYRLGPTVLRTSTAGVAAAAVLLARAGRWDR
jgi:16S rRNA (uracil1498-N3)-methyltransferase